MNRDKYRNYLKEGIYKFIPEFIFPRYKAKILDTIIVDGEKIGDIVGLNLKEIDYSNEEILKEYIKNIIEMEVDNYKTIYIEEIAYRDVKIKEFIEKETNLRFATGDGIKYYNIPLIIEDIFKFIERDILKQEVLLIVDNKKDAIKIIKHIKHIFKFISLIGIYGNEGKEVYEEVLEKYGISIYQPLRLDSNLSVYDLIINTSKENLSQLKGIKRKTIVFDFNRLNINDSLENKAYITDVKFNIEDYNIEDNIWLENIISSEVYESIFGSKMERYYKIIVGKKRMDYNIKEYIDESMKIKGVF